VQTFRALTFSRYVSLLVYQELKVTMGCGMNHKYKIYNTKIMQVFRIKCSNFTPNLLYTADNKDYESFLNIR